MCLKKKKKNCKFCNGRVLDFGEWSGGSNKVVIRKNKINIGCFICLIGGFLLFKIQINHYPRILLSLKLWDYLSWK